MHTHYSDILGATSLHPKWFDENAVPRFAPFEPKWLANIYADECVLLEVHCQACDRRFVVAMSSSRSQRIMRAALTGDDELVREAEAHTLASSIRDDSIHYGDPPNVACCPAGPTMNSVPRRVLQYWTRSAFGEWKRDRTPKGELAPDWALDD